MTDQPEPEHEPDVLEDDDEPMDWDLDERDRWLAEHEGEEPDLDEVVLTGANE